MSVCTSVSTHLRSSGLCDFTHMWGPLANKLPSIFARLWFETLGTENSWSSELLRLETRGKRSQVCKNESWSLITISIALFCPLSFLSTELPHVFVLEVYTCVYSCVCACVCVCVCVYKHAHDYVCCTDQCPSLNKYVVNYICSMKIHTLYIFSGRNW